MNEWMTTSNRKRPGSWFATSIQYSLHEVVHTTTNLIVKDDRDKTTMREDKRTIIWWEIHIRTTDVKRWRKPGFILYTMVPWDICSMVPQTVVGILTNGLKFRHRISGMSIAGIVVFRCQFVFVYCIRPHHHANSTHQPPHRSCNPKPNRHNTIRHNQLCPQTKSQPLEVYLVIPLASGAKNGKDTALSTMEDLCIRTNTN